MRRPHFYKFLTAFIVLGKVTILAASAASSEIGEADQLVLKKAMTEFFLASTNSQETWRFDQRLDRLLSNDERVVRRLCWEAFTNAPIHHTAREDFDSKQVQFGKYLS